MNDNGDREMGTARVRLEDGLRELRVPEQPPAELEQLVVAALGGRIAGHSAERTSPFRRWAMAAAAVALFAAGTLFGARTAAPVRDGSDTPLATEAPRYALLLLPGADQHVPTAEEEAATVERYRAWAGRLADDDRLVLAEKLGPTVSMVSADGPVADRGPRSATDELLGVFVITAASDDDAVATALASPHAREGGVVAVVRIE